MQARRPVSALTAGTYVHSIAGQPVGATVSADPHPTPDGTRVLGPRGGRYELIAVHATADGNLRDRLSVPFGNRTLAGIRAEAVAVVEVAEEW
jgi:hypothetical protein